MLRFAGLDDDPAGGAAASGTAPELLQQLEGALIGPEVLDAHETVGLEDGDETETVKVEAFGNDLSANEYIDVTFSEPSDEGGLLRVRRISVQTGNAPTGKQGSKLFFYLLRTRAKGLQCTVARRAFTRIRLRMSAVVAHQPIRAVVAIAVAVTFVRDARS